MDSPRCMRASYFSLTRKDGLGISGEEKMKNAAREGWRGKDTRCRWRLGIFIIF